MERKCENCEYYEIEPDQQPGVEIGYCHRFPPVWAPEAETEEHEACCYTRVIHFMWCGEFKPRDSEENTKLEIVSKAKDKFIIDIGLSVRARNGLRSIGVVTVGQLTKLTVKDFFNIRNFGQKSINEIKEKLDSMGLSLSPSEYDDDVF